MDHAILKAPTSTRHHQPSIFSSLAIAIGVGMALAILAGMIGGKVHGWRGGVAMLILLGIPTCAVGTAMAIIALVWRKENPKLGQAALWLNGMIAFFGFPLMIYWVLALAQ